MLNSAEEVEGVEIVDVPYGATESLSDGGGWTVTDLNLLKNIIFSYNVPISSE